MTAPDSPRTKLPVFFISHGGGPWPWMQDQTGGVYDVLADSLRQMRVEQGPAVRAVLMISAHWEEAEFSIMSHPRPPMIYDYYGFPAHTYQVVYGAPGAPSGLVERVQALIEGAGLTARVDPTRGFDHGTFSPLAISHPDAEVPVFQVSLKTGLDPAAHLALGRALAPLREEGVALVGSGLSYHNLRAFGAPGRAPSAAFDAWLQHSLVGRDAADRDQALQAWASAPAARIAHPREEHLLPLMVAAGAAGDDRAVCCYHESDFYGSLTVSSFRFGEPVV